jgi:transposase InsO family protein
MDITYIPMARGFVYLAVVLDWFSRRVLSWRLSITMEASFCVETLNDALAQHGKPDICNTDQGSQFTGATNGRPWPLYSITWSAARLPNVALLRDHSVQAWL